MQFEKQEITNKIISPYSIVSDIKRSSPRLYDLPVYTYSGEVGVVKKELSSSVISWCNGAGYNKDDALTSTIGESIERYSWLMPSRRLIKLSKEEELSVHFCPIEDAGFVFKNELGEKQILETISRIEIPWMNATVLPESKEILVPALDIYRGSRPKEIEDWLVLTSNGFAAGHSIEEASLHAIFELIERDATMQFWYHKQESIPRFKMSTNTNNVSQVLAKAKNLNLKVEIFNITTDLKIPAVAVFIHNKEKLACGSASDLNTFKAVKKALLEASSMWNSLEGLIKYKKTINKNEKSEGFPSIKGFDDHVHLYTHKWAKKGYEFLTSDNYETVLVDEKFNNKQIEPKKQLENLIHLSKKKGYKVIIADITPDDIKELGFYVVKAIIPGLVPLLVGKYTKTFSSRFPEVKIINKWPHPFP
jgi:ribosomal protein S12 methylthiotransferase accessory factor